MLRQEDKVQIIYNELQSSFNEILGALVASTVSMRLDAPLKIFETEILVNMWPPLPTYWPPSLPACCAGKIRCALYNPKGQNLNPRASHGPFFAR
jgi:hypothetical protein